MAAFFKKPVAQSEASRKVSRPAPLLTTRLPVAAERDIDNEVTPPLLHGSKTQRSPSTAKTPINNKKKACLFPPQIPEHDATAKPSLLDEYKARKSKTTSGKDSSQSSKLAEASVRLTQSKSKELLKEKASKERLKEKASVDESVVRGVQSLKIKCDAVGVESGPPPVEVTEKQKDSAYFNIVRSHSLHNTQDVLEDQNAPADAIVTWKDPDLWERYLAIEDRKGSKSFFFANLKGQRKLKRIQRRQRGCDTSAHLQTRSII